MLETERGPLCYLDAGDGPPVLYFHGTGVASDAAGAMERPLVEQGFRFIVPNRPGYFGTPIECGKEAADAVWLAARLLDKLNIERAGVVATSGGGAAAIGFASQCADRTAALVLQCAQSHQWTSGDWMPKGSAWMLPFLRPRFVRQLLNWGRHMQIRANPWLAKLYLRAATGRRYAEVKSDPVARELCRLIAEHQLHCVRQPAGIDNDLSMFLSESMEGINSIRAPTLIIHDRLDPICPFVHAEWAASQIPNAELLDVAAGGHFIWIGGEAARMRERRREFLQKFAGR